MNYRKISKAELIREHKKMAPVYFGADIAAAYMGEARSVLLMLRENCDEDSREREIIGAAISLIVEAEISLNFPES